MAMTPEEQAVWHAERIRENLREQQRLDRERQFVLDRLDRERRESDARRLREQKEVQRRLDAERQRQEGIRNEAARQERATREADRPVPIAPKLQGSEVSAALRGMRRLKF